MKIYMTENEGAMKDGLTFDQWFALNRYAPEHREMFATVWNAALENAAIDIGEPFAGMMERIRA